eukprot:scaffold5659_cov121-Isochrysis_galbana.AAC.10
MPRLPSALGLSGACGVAVGREGAATPEGVLLHSHPEPRAGALAGGQAEASSVQCQARAGTRLSRGRAIIPGMSSRRCCRRGHAWRPCPRSDSPRWAPAEAGEAPS